MKEGDEYTAVCLAMILHPAKQLFPKKDEIHRIEEERIIVIRGLPPLE